MGLKIELDLIGNMPRHLVKKKWSVQKISSSEIQAGDLLFLHSKKSERLVTHVALALSAQKVFHCTPKSNGCVEPLEAISQEWEFLEDANALLSYVDPRPSREPS